MKLRRARGSSESIKAIDGGHEAQNSTLKENTPQRLDARGGMRREDPQ